MLRAVVALPQPMQPIEETALRVRIAALETRHRDLDMVLAHLLATEFRDELVLKRMKKEKLALKDQIEHLRAQLVPDIPA